MLQWVHSKETERMKMSAINWLIEKSEITLDSEFEYFEGAGMVKTVIRNFAGTLPYKMVQEVKSYFENQNATFRGTNGESTYNIKTETGSMSLTTGAYKSTETTVRFSVTEYIIKSS
jgi:hypothetical protein